MTKTKNVKKTVKKVQRGTLYLTDGTKRDAVPANGRKFTLRELQHAVGGYIELVICEERAVVGYVNENGYAKRLPPNPHTWNVVKRRVYELNGYLPSWRILGPILVVKNVEAQP